MGIFYTRKDLTGEKFGRLKPIKIVDIRITKSSPYGDARWECICDCGKTKVISARTLLKKVTKSCGCLRAELSRKPPGDATRNSLYCSYRSTAKKRNLCFELSREEFYKIISGNCEYCNSPPTRRFSQHKATKMSKEWLEKSAIFRNGVDRKDNKIGYTLKNCVSCCKDCNEMKHVRDITYFIEHINKIYNHMNKENK